MALNRFARIPIAYHKGVAIYATPELQQVLDAHTDRTGGVSTPMPGVFSAGVIDSTGAVTFSHGASFTVASVDAGAFRVTWNTAQGNAEYVVFVQPVNALGSTRLTAQVGTVTTTQWDYRMRDAADANTKCDVEFVCFRKV